MEAYAIDTREGLACLRRAREAFLGDNVLPNDLPEWLSAAWRRSRFHGVDVSLDHVPAAPVRPDTPLVSAAKPVLSRLVDSLAGVGAAVVLSDPQARIVGCWAADNSTRAHLDRIDTRPGANLAEDVTGTNGISYTLDSRAPFLIAGPQHLFELYQDTVCAGVPISDPVSQRVAGAVALVCGLDAPLAVLRALATAAGNAIETELQLAATTHERRLLEAYLRAHGGRNPVAVLDGRTRIVSDAAAALLRPRDLDTLESFAIEAARDGRLSTATLSVPESELTIHMRPATSEDNPGIVATVKQAGASRRRPQRAVRHPSRSTPRLTGLVGTSPAWLTLERAIDAAIEGTRPVLLIGAAGVGKTTIARAIADVLAPCAGQVERDRVRVLDPPATTRDEEQWVPRLVDALHGSAVVLLRHIEHLSDALTDRVVELITNHDARVIATLSTQNGSPRRSDRLRARWAPSEIVVPTLRERTEDIPEFASRFARPYQAEFTHDALATLQRHDWPGNVAELKAVIEGAARDRAGPLVAHDLPDRLRSSAAHPRLTDLEKSERATIAEALHATGGNRVQAANRLGIGRATLYRKLRRYGLQ